MSEHQSRDPQQMPEAQPAAVAPGVSRVRRNLLRAGAIGAPALISLKPASVIACSCKLPSGFSVSGNASRGPKNCVDYGRKASIWYSSTNCQTASPYKYFSGGTIYSINKNTLASAIGLSTNGSYPDATLDVWLRKGDSHEQGLIVACYLEAIANGNDSTWPKKDKFVTMWNSGVIAGSYTPPNQTTPWTKAKVIAYLKFLTNQA